MDFNQLIDSIDVANLRCSVLLVTPKQAFLDWLDGFKERRGVAAYDVYFREQDSVWLIPQIDRFSEEGSYLRFVEFSKPRLLLSELYRFGATENDFEHPITAETFDTFFDVELREEIAVIPKPSS